MNQKIENEDHLTKFTCTATSSSSSTSSPSPPLSPPSPSLSPPSPSLSPSPTTHNRLTEEFWLEEGYPDGIIKGGEGHVPKHRHEAAGQPLDMGEATMGWFEQHRQPDMVVR